MGSFAIGPVATNIASLIFVVLIASGDGALGKFYNINFNLFNLIRADANLLKIRRHKYLNDNSFKNLS